MSEDFTLTVRIVIEACKKALEERTLGAFHTDTCRYVYPDNDAPALGCAIGVSLPASIRRSIADRGVNGSPVGRLFAHLRLPRLSGADMDVLRITQAYHDTWAGKSTLILPLTLITAGDMAAPLKEFVEKHNFKKIGEHDFRDWIKLLDEVYPA